MIVSESLQSPSPDNVPARAFHFQQPDAAIWHAPKPTPTQSPTPSNPHTASSPSALPLQSASKNLEQQANLHVPFPTTEELLQAKSESTVQPRVQLGSASVPKAVQLSGHQQHALSTCVVSLQSNAAVSDKPEVSLDVFDRLLSSSILSTALLRDLHISLAAGQWGLSSDATSDQLAGTATSDHTVVLQVQHTTAFLPVSSNAAHDIGSFPVVTAWTPGSFHGLPRLPLPALPSVAPLQPSAHASAATAMPATVLSHISAQSRSPQAESTALAIIPALASLQPSPADLPQPRMPLQQITQPGTAHTTLVQVCTLLEAPDRIDGLHGIGNNSSVAAMQWHVPLSQQSDVSGLLNISGMGCKESPACVLMMHLPGKQASAQLESLVHSHSCLL